MACSNELYKLKTEEFGQHEVWHQALANLVACIAPFAPHISEELWHQLGHSSTVNKDSWPKYDEKFLIQDKVTIVIQVNGKLRGEVEVDNDSDEETVVEAAKSNPKVSGYLMDQTIRKTIFVPNKLVNFVV